ncbi:riboflavin kinase [Coemansia sp. Benny D115]|nr:riboflavin kinase [Coemansia sp. Benny D115]
MSSQHTDSPQPSSGASASARRPSVAGPEVPEAPFPLFVSGAVSRGFGRGGKQLGIPTANLPEESVQAALRDIPVGVYLGWAQVDGLTAGPEPMVMSLGWNPYFKNERRSGEVHIMRAFSEDFYGAHMRVAVLAYIRPERDYASLDDLVRDIHVDIDVARKSLQRPAYLRVKDDAFFTDPHQA